VPTKDIVKPPFPFEEEIAAYEKFLFARYLIVF